MPKEDIQLFDDDKSGYQTIPAPGFENMDPSKRVHYGQRLEFVTYLQGHHLNKMTENFVSRLSRILQQELSIAFDNWTYIPDLYEFMRRHLFRASVETTCGEHVFELCPTFYEDYWAYEDSISTLIKDIPRWWAPRAYESRDKMHNNLKTWQKHSAERFDWDSDDKGVDYEPLFGPPLMRAMQRRYRASGFSDTGKAANTLGYLIA